MNGYLEAAEQAARLGGEILLRWIPEFTVTEKSSRNLVTQADLESEKSIREFLLNQFPNHGFLGEESGHTTNLSAEYCWIVDPLDGTTNYVHQLPSYCVSIALRFREQIVAGVVYDPLLDECFKAATEQGAVLNDQPIHVSSNQNLNEALVATSLPAHVAADSLAIRQFMSIVYSCRGFRRLGSAALNLCYVAMGRLDAYWATSLNIWDVAAGCLILQEAGGCLRHIDNREFELSDPRMIAASNQVLLDRLFEAIEDDDLD